MSEDERGREGSIQHPIEVFLDLLAGLVAEDLLRPGDAVAPREPKKTAPDPGDEMAKSTLPDDAHDARPSPEIRA
jgi:hypothetical protein